MMMGNFLKVPIKSYLSVSEQSWNGLIHFSTGLQTLTHYNNDKAEKNPKVVMKTIPQVCHSFPSEFLVEIFKPASLKNSQFISSEEWFLTNHSTIKARLMECCIDACPSVRFSHQHKGTLDLVHHNRWLAGHQSDKASFARFN